MDTSFLCEFCGYNLEGAETDARCPECGHPVADSLPAARPGSPWQQQPGLLAWAKTVRAVLFHPTRLYSDVSMASVGKGFLAVNVLLTGALIVAPWAGVLIGDPARHARTDGMFIGSGIMAASYAVQVLVVAAVLTLLTLFDIFGLQLLGKTRRWRLPSAAAWAICCHASAGWLLAGFLPLVAMAWYYIVGTLLRVPFTGRVFPGASTALRLTWQELLGLGLPVVGYLAGLVAFELLAIKGVKLRRFANVPTTTSDAPAPAAQQPQP